MAYDMTTEGMSESQCGVVTAEYMGETSCQKSNFISIYNKT